MVLIYLFLRDVPNLQASYDVVAEAPSALLKPMVKVQQVVLGYGVGLEVKMNTEPRKKVNDYIVKATEHKGYVSIFRVPWGGVAGSGSYSENSTVTFEDVQMASLEASIVIPPKNSGYLVRLTATGAKLA